MELTIKVRKPGSLQIFAADQVELRQDDDEDADPSGPYRYVAISAGGHDLPVIDLKARDVTGVYVEHGAYTRQAISRWPGSESDEEVVSAA